MFKKKEKKKLSDKQKSAIIIIWGIVLFSLIYLFLAPLNPSSVQVKPNPSSGYEESMARIAKINEAEKDTIMPECLSYANTVGRKTANVIVVYHGYTNCPIQYKPLSDQLVAQGYNVVVLRAPNHGEKDRNNNTLSTTTTSEVAKYANDSVDIARGLGDNVSVTGLSVGGAVTTWVAQYRDDVKEYFPMAPFYAPKMVPGPLTNGMIRIMNVLPPIHIWWDSKTKENNVTGSPYAYPGFDTHSLAAFLSFGDYWTQLLNRDGGKNIVPTLVINENDGAINNVFAQRKNKSGALKNDNNYVVYDFAKKYGLDHDIIDPYNPKQNMELVYPILINLFNARLK
jgi:pimeloyl-ACP methyl ester carboxylesterase